MLKTNKPYTMYTHPDNSYVVSLASSPSGLAVVSGHLDGSLWRFTFPADEGSGGLGHVQVRRMWGNVSVGRGHGVCVGNSPVGWQWSATTCGGSPSRLTRPGPRAGAWG